MYGYLVFCAAVCLFNEKLRQLPKIRDNYSIFLRLCTLLAMCAAIHYPLHTIHVLNRALTNQQATAVCVCSWNALATFFFLLLDVQCRDYRAEKTTVRC